MKDEINLSSLYCKKEDIVTRRIAGETLLVPIRSHLADMQRIYGLNPEGEYIWQQLDGRHSLAQIHAGVTANFAVTGEQAESDIREFIGQLLAAEIVAAPIAPADFSEKREV